MLDDLDIARAFLAAKRAGAIANVWIDRGVIRVQYRHHSPRVRLTRAQAVNLLARLARRGDESRRRNAPDFLGSTDRPAIHR